MTLTSVRPRSCRITADDHGTDRRAVDRDVAHGVQPGLGVDRPSAAQDKVVLASDRHHPRLGRGSACTLFRRAPR